MFLSNLFSGVKNWWYNLTGQTEKTSTAQYNRQIDLENREYQAQREDNAVQRRVADLQAAGLSPTLAAGSSAGSSPMSIGHADQREAQIMSMLMMKQNYAQTKAQTEALQLQNKLTSLDLKKFNKLGLAPFEATNKVASASGTVSILGNAVDKIKSSILGDNTIAGASSDLLPEPTAEERDLLYQEYQRRIRSMSIQKRLKAGSFEEFLNDWYSAFHTWKVTK